jgi:hypothetical protein
LRELIALEILQITEAPAMTDLEFVAPLTNIRKLMLRNCGSIADLTPIANLTHLECVYLDGNLEITDVSPLGKLDKLREVLLKGCTGVTDVSCLKRLPALESLNVDQSGVNYDALPQDMQEKGETLIRSFQKHLGTPEGEEMQQMAQRLLNISKPETFFQRLLRKLRGG